MEGGIVWLLVFVQNISVILWPFSLDVSFLTFFCFCAHTTLQFHLNYIFFCGGNEQFLINPLSFERNVETCVFLNLTPHICLVDFGVLRDSCRYLFMKS
jgi:hypothetical protein